ncbi:MAG: FMN-binding glutamate synthase family protein [Bacteroidetes bacterium]|nr:FMN-binding glutamate synthase family protein [Bacteroidota bacterium]MDA1120418.1 FMN-binding glutamate synthase family protein [Bacteroidota bacterium]
MRKLFLIVSSLLIAAIAIVSLFWIYILWAYVVVGPLVLIGISDILQKKRAILKNFPLLGHFRYMLETIRPEINQYFIESNSDGVPFSREMRTLVYQRAKNQLDTLPFGTQTNVYEDGYEWVNHSLKPVHVNPESLRVIIGGADCKQPYSASILNVSAMSYGALSKNAIQALNSGAKMGGFSHNTGEGGLSPHHLKHGGDLVWQIGTGYFGARKSNGTFDSELFKERSRIENVKMVEIKLSQGAKPGHGGILPAAKITKEIAEIRNVGFDKDVVSPPAHSAFSTPLEMMEFVGQLRELSGGKPIGIKLCIGKRREFLSMCKAMLKSGICPDYIVIDGGEGGTGAAPLEFSNHIGAPLTEALIFARNALVGFALKDKVRLISSAKIISGFDVIKNIAIGADLCNSARAMMMALGCIQAITCNTNRCPTGVATQDPTLYEGLVVSDKSYRVMSYQQETVKSVAEILGAMGLSKTSDLRYWHRMRRTDATQIKHYGEIYEFLKNGDLLKPELPKSFDRAVRSASPDTFSWADGDH